MGRPAFSLTDQQARLLAERVHDINIACPLDGSSHRPFVREFIAAVHRATGELFSPTIYRRLLGAYAPERTPSTVTIANELRRFAAQLDAASLATDCVTSTVDDEFNGGNCADLVHAGELVHLLRDVVRDAVALPHRAAPPPGSSSVEQRFLQTRLDEAEKELRLLRERTQALSTELVVAHHSAALHKAETLRLHESLAQQASATSTLAAASEDARRFALQAIDVARGETRMWKERCGVLEKLLRRDALLLEHFRQAAYRAGAAIPPTLQPDNPL